MPDKFKFDVVIGNPPYQEEAKDTSDKPIYHLFMDEAFKVGERVTFITPARFLFNAGKTPKAWNQKMLEDEHLKVAYYEREAARVFPGSMFEGGVAVTYRDANIKCGAIGRYTPYPKLNEILKKVINFKEPSLNRIIYPQNRFDLERLYAVYPGYKNLIGSGGREKRLTTSIFMNLPDLFKKAKSSDSDLAILGLMNAKRVSMFVPKKFIEPGVTLDRYKVLVPKSNGASGTLGDRPARIISTPEAGEPGKGFTQSFISIGAFEAQAESEAALKYVKSKFARVMLGVLKITQDNTSSKWKYVPLQDFTASSDIDWTKTVREIDEQLYEKYGLDESEIDFIESHVKEME